MSKGPKVTTNQQTSGTTTNTYGLGPQADSADIRALRSSIAPVESDPSIPFAFAKERERINNSFRNPLGAYTSAATRDAANRSAGGQLQMGERVASEASRQAAQERNFQQQAAVAGMTAPSTVQTSGSSTGSIQGTQVQSPGWGASVGQLAGLGVGLI